MYVVSYHTLGLTKEISDLFSEGNVVMKEDNCPYSPSSLEREILLCDHAVKEHQTGNSLVLSSLHGLCINNDFVESSQVPILPDSRYHNQETDSEQNVERESAEDGRYMYTLK